MALPVAEPPVSRRERLQALTGLRIFAAGFVYLSHIGAPKGAPGWLANFTASGYMGVTLFFILSGFVLALNYADDLRRPTRGTLWRYFVARIARVYPLYLLVLVYAIVSIRTAGGGTPRWVEHVFALQAWDANLGVVYSLNAPAWSVSVEVFLYALFPVVVILIARLRSTRSLVAVAVGVAAVMLGLALWFTIGGASREWADAGSAHRWLYRSPLCRLGDFTLGIVAARLYVLSRATGRSTGGRTWGWAAIVAAATVIGLMMLKPLYGTAWSWDVAYALPCVVLILALAMRPAGALGRVLSRPLVVLLGEASYAFYLVHWMLIPGLGAGRWTRDVTGMVVVREVMIFGVVLMVAVGLHVVVERPARVRVRRLLRGERRETPVAASPAPVPAAATAPAATAR
jgi:peptidoglycan/LPS O-acetylase OafA/YrhL